MPAPHCRNVVVDHLGPCLPRQLKTHPFFSIFPILGTNLWLQVAGWLVVGSIVSENCINWAYKSGLGHIYVSDLSISPT